jgi:2-amino-4-hydroxy-6-hydroxymethyldihydropteridine diphosphokinase
VSGARVGYLGLGSNVGDRRANLQAALDGLVGRGVAVADSSATYDTDPVGEILDQPAFLNACLRIETALEPLELLELCKALERDLGRAPDAVRHGPRLIDIDVLLLGELEQRCERLALPHAQVLTRRFVLIPLLELDFELCTPAGERLADALAALDFSEGVRRAGPKLDLAAASASGSPTGGRSWNVAP